MKGWRLRGKKKKMRRRRNAEPEVSIDLDMTNERRLILRHRHPRQKSTVMFATFRTPLKDISYSSKHVQLIAYLINNLNMSEKMESFSHGLQTATSAFKTLRISQHLKHLLLYFLIFFNPCRTFFNHGRLAVMNFQHICPTSISANQHPGTEKPSATCLNENIYTLLLN